MAAPAEAKPLELQVEGMTCAACSRRVQKALERVDGVTGVEVDLVRERARVTGARIDPHGLAVAADQAGYRVSILDASAPRKPRTRETSGPALLALALAALLTALPFVWRESTTRLVIELVLGAAVTFGLGGTLIRRALDEVLARAPGMSFLVASGAVASLALHAYALARLLEPGPSPGGVHPGDVAHGQMAHSDAATAATIVAFVLIGRWLEARARHRVGEALDALETPLSRSARVVRHGAEGDIEASDLRIGDVMVVPPHGVIVADGTVASESSALIDEAWLTGESQPVERGPGAVVHAGTVNTTRSFRMQVTALGRDTRRAQIADMVSAALAEKSEAVLLAERWSARVVPVVLGVAGVTMAALLFTSGDVALAMTRAVTVLVIACPCALGLATPTAIAAALGSALRAGILVRLPSQLERLPEVTSVVFDKTGTLTEGKPRPTRIHLEHADGSEDELLRIAAAVETESEHPLGRAIFEEAMRRKLKLPVAQAVSAVERGVKGVVDGREIVVRALTEAEETAETRRERAQGASLVSVEAGGASLGWIAIADALRPESVATVAALRARGLSLYLLSGDHPLAAAARGLEAGLDRERVEGGLSPDRKRARLEELGRAGPVLMIGDGINDAPALAQAAVGIAIGRGAQVAIETAGITLDGGLTRLITAFTLADQTRRVIRQNLGLAFAYNVVAMPMAALGALDAIGGSSVAALAMAMSSTAVVLSSLRLTRPPV